MIARIAAPYRRLGARVAAVFLAALAGLHAAWTTGSTFPVDTRQELAELVVGDKSTMPSSGTTLAMAALFTAGAFIVAERARTATMWPSPTERISCLGARVLAITFTLRGVGGFIISGFGLGDSTERFVRWDLWLYSPLCLVIAAGAAMVWYRIPREPERTPTAV